MIVRAATQRNVAADLRAYLQSRLGVSDLGYAEEPISIDIGWETYIYQFRLRPTAGLPPHFTRRLILRAYSSAHGVPRARHEFAAGEHMRQLGYPAARPLLRESSCEPFGGPFLILEWVPGRTLIEQLIRRPWRIFDIPGRLADMHVRLHELPAEGFPAPPGPFLERRLEEMRGHVCEHALHGMLPGLDWLAGHRPAPPRTPCILHLDFHPLNLLFEDGRCNAVLDWNESDVGDRHADVAATIVLIRSAPVEVPTFSHRLLALPARPMMRRRYLRAYRRRLPLDTHILTYYLAFAAFRRLLHWGMWLRATPCIMGCKPSSVRYLSADRVNFLRDRFHEWAGVGIRL